MKISIRFILILSFLITMSSAIRAQTELIDSSKVFAWNNTLLQYDRCVGGSFYRYDSRNRLIWKFDNYPPNSVFLYTWDYDNNDSIINEMDYDGITGRLDFQFDYLYDGNRHVIAKICQVNNRNGLDTMSSNYYRYDSLGILRCHIKEEFRDSFLDDRITDSILNGDVNTPYLITVDGLSNQGVWTHFFKDLKSYHSGKVDTVIHMPWAYSIYYVHDRTIYSDTLILKQIWDNGMYVDDSRDIYKYDQNGYRISFLRQTWNGIMWQTTAQEKNIYTLTYDLNGNLITYERQDWQDSVWFVSMRDSIEYNADNLVSHWVVYEYSDSSYTFREAYNSYDSLGNLDIQKYKYIYRGTTVTNDSIKFYYHKAAILPSGIQYPFLSQNISVYPMPAQSVIVVHGLEGPAWTAEIHDMSGREVLIKKITSQSSNIDVGSLSRGTYQMILTCDDGSHVVKKIVLD